MKQFSGFPARMEFTPVPNVFFSELLPRLDDIAELKTALYALAALYRKKGYPRYLTAAELGASPSLMQGLAGGEKDLAATLGRLVERGVFLRVRLQGEAAQDVYFLNDADGRQAAEKLQNGELKLGGLRAVRPAAKQEPAPDIFTLYEQNIGMLTPMIAEELREAVRHYPESWIADAIREAVALNKRNIRYIMRILEKWSVEGRGDGKNRRHPQADPDKYVKGKYGHMVQR